jgi:hypothetical protein
MGRARGIGSRGSRREACAGRVARLARVASQSRGSRRVAVLEARAVSQSSRLASVAVLEARNPTTLSQGYPVQRCSGRRGDRNSSAQSVDAERRTRSTRDSIPLLGSTPVQRTRATRFIATRRGALDRGLRPKTHCEKRPTSRSPRGENLRWAMCFFADTSVPHGDGAHGEAPVLDEDDRLRRGSGSRLVAAGGAHARLHLGCGSCNRDCICRVSGLPPYGTRAQRVTTTHHYTNEDAE